MAFQKGHPCPFHSLTGQALFAAKLKGRAVIHEDRECFPIQYSAAGPVPEL